MESPEVQIGLGSLASVLKGGLLLLEFLVKENKKGNASFVPVGVSRCLEADWGKQSQEMQRTLAIELWGFVF